MKALDSVSWPTRSAVIERLMISIVAPPNPIKAATMNISLDVNTLFHWQPKLKQCVTINTNDHWGITKVSRTKKYINLSYPNVPKNIQLLRQHMLLHMLFSCQGAW